MSDPIPRDNGEFNIDRKRVILREALDAFRVSILENDTLYKVICTVLHKNKIDSAYTNFSIEPNVIGYKGKTQYGLSLVRYREDNSASNGNTNDGRISAAVINIVPILVMNDYGGVGEVIFMETFVQLAIGKDVDKRKLMPEEETALEEDVKIFMDSLYKFILRCEQGGVELVPDMHGRPQLLEDGLDTPW